MVRRTTPSYLQNCAIISSLQQKVDLLAGIWNTLSHRVAQGGLRIKRHLESEGSLSASNDLQSLSLSGVQHRCAEESERFFQRRNYDPRFCFELFRRALLEHDQRAWETIHHQYHPLVMSWVQRHGLLQALDEEADYFANRAFEKMWAAFSPQKFHQFPDLKSILRYLQMCVHSVIVDYARGSEQLILFEDSEREPLVLRDPGQSSLEEKVFTRRQAAECRQNPRPHPGTA